jgi:hypothetical protein
MYLHVVLPSEHFKKRWRKEKKRAVLQMKIFKISDIKKAVGKTILVTLDEASISRNGTTSS